MKSRTLESGRDEVIRRHSRAIRGASPKLYLHFFCQVDDASSAQDLVEIVGHPRCFIQLGSSCCLCLSAIMSSRSATGYHLRTTGAAAETAAAHTPSDKSEASIHFLGACFCPFVHRSWIALEVLNQLIVDPAKRKESKIDYIYDECDPYQKEQRLVEISPKGLVPVSSGAVFFPVACLTSSRLPAWVKEDRCTILSVGPREI